MKFVSSKFAIAQALLNRNTPLAVAARDGAETFLLWVKSVEREDGSGRSFNITGDLKNQLGHVVSGFSVFHVVTID